MKSFKLFYVLVHFFLLAGIMTNSIYIPVYQSVMQINDDTFERVESNWNETQEEEGDEKRDKNEDKKIELQILFQKNIKFSGFSKSLFDVKSIIQYQFKLEIPFPPPDRIV
ncbi:MAG: hypothetical protein ACR2MI_01605 [Flavobacteriaceae bacterium]